MFTKCMKRFLSFASQFIKSFFLYAVTSGLTNTAWLRNTRETDKTMQDFRGKYAKQNCCHYVSNKWRNSSVFNFSFNSSFSALKTFLITNEISDSETQKRNPKLLQELPLAKTLNIIVNLVDMGIAFLILLSFLWILGPDLFSNNSES
jgi:hypothetical protein